ncbi:hypothetical protein O0235_10545 [Tepidiforma flava]|uniref:Uncharacterized protein n=1 Tax=Tepidiforma flava TaxID=3004094 RepID=A0ABY7M3U4_9CHLR|nr:hypothetical protein [Tepidiforma flava]WBL35226.1 hypothetical protein O0235_10545 [Tepidiforma flava]
MSSPRTSQSGSASRPSEIVVVPSTDTALPDVVITIGRDFKVPGT